MQMRTIKNKGSELSSYTLLETLFVLIILSSLFLFPFVSLSSWYARLAVHRFFTQFEKRIYTTQKTAIVNQQHTRITYDKEEAQIIFDVLPHTVHWRTLEIPEELEIKQAPTLTFIAKTGNESSLSAYQFYWKKEEQIISYQFQMGSGHYLKKIEKK